MTLRSLFFILVLFTAVRADANLALLYADTSNPRATMESFLALTEEAADRYDEFRETPSRSTQKSLEQVSIQAARLFDLRQVAPANRRKVADETFYLLWEVISRIKLPAVSEIPANPAADSADDSNAEPVDRWRIPHTGISIARVKEGIYAGEYQFDAETVENAWAYYEAVRELPYEHKMRIKNAYRINEQIAGWMIPMAWVEALPDGFNITLFGQVLWKWVIVLLMIGIAIFIVVIVYRWARRKPWDGSLKSYLRYLSTPVTFLIILPIVSFFARDQINTTGAAATLLYYVFFISYGVTLVWMVWLSANQVADAIISRSSRVKAGSLDASFLKLISRSIGVVAVLVLIFKILNELGVPVYGLVTGAGIGGIAIALAARSTLENFMGALNLFADRPVSIGDLCRYDEESVLGWRPVGKVESIGLRSTKIRRTDGALITIPNAEFAQRNIVNLTNNEYFLLSSELGLRYETTDDQLHLFIENLREFLLEHPHTINTEEFPVSVRLIGFAESYLKVKVHLYINAKQHSDFLDIQEDILFHIRNILEHVGAELALPSQTLYIKDESGGEDEK